MERRYVGSPHQPTHPIPLKFPYLTHRTHRELLQSAATALSAMGALGSLLAAFPGAAGAASPVINELKIRESVKGVKESVEALKLYEDFVSTKDFYGIKKSLRVPPVSEIRKDCRRIIAGLDGPIKKDTDKAYNQFIENLEQVDFLATKAIQNDNKADDKELAQMTARFADAQVKLGKVLELILTTRYATEPVNVRLETASTEL